MPSLQRRGQFSVLITAYIVDDFCFEESESFVVKGFSDFLGDLKRSASEEKKEMN